MKKKGLKKNETIFDRLMNKRLDRREFLLKTEKIVGLVTGIGLIGSIPFVGYANLGRTGPSVKTSSKSIGYPFELGVASGEPLPDSVLLWTRLIPHDKAMPSEPVDVQWQVSEDESFNKIVNQGTYVAKPEFAHSVHAEVEDLLPNQWYFYRFMVGGEVSPIGRTKTMPELGDSVDRLNFAFVSCQRYTEGYYTAYDHLVEEDLDLVLFLGDYIYEGGSWGGIREHTPQRHIFSLNDYRIRYSQYKSDPSLQAAHAAFPWIVTLDDHEVENDWAGHDKNEALLTRRKVAFQAFYEHMPLRKSSVPEDINMQLYRRFRYGNLVDFNVLDTRQYRSILACGGGDATHCPERFDPSRTMLGDEQENWLCNGLTSSSVQWNVLAQQVMMAQETGKHGERTFRMDQWDGYIASRNQLFEIIKGNNVNNVIVLTGDAHRNYVSDLKEDFNDPNSPILGTEFVGTSLSSGGNGLEIDSSAQRVLGLNPHIKYANTQRGYVRCNLTPDCWQTDFRVVPFVDSPGAHILTHASFLVENGRPGAVIN